MAPQRLTQCPHCKASFKVSEAQLNAANGRVRCGACMNIFDAIAYSITQNSDDTSDTNKASSEDPSENPATESPISNDPVDLEEELFADNPEEDKAEAGYSGSQNLTEEFSTSFLELEDEPSNDPYSTSFKKIEDDFISDEPVDESWTQDILDDMDETSANQRKEPHIGHNEELEISSVATEFEKSPRNKDIHSPQTETSIADALDFPEPPESQSYESIDFEYQQDSAFQNRHWSMTLLFVIVNITLLVVLLAQTSWYHYEKMVKYPKLAKLYEMACEQLSCSLPKLEDISKIKSKNLVVRSHPTTRKSLIIDTIIINEASFEQDFPSIALYFSDINRNIIAQRLVSPAEYRSGDLLSWTKMPSDQPIHISIEILDPGKEAVNYNLEFFPGSKD